MMDATPAMPALRPAPTAEHVDSDAELLRRYAYERSEAAFAALARRYGNLVYASALRQLHDRHQADDVTQAVFLLLSTKASGVRGTHLPAWLLATTRYACLDTIKKNARRRRYESAAAATKPEVTMPDAPHDDGRITLCLDAAMQRLNARDRTAIAIRYLQDRPLSDVAGTLALSPAAAQKVVTRALAKLRGKLASFGVMTPSVDALAVALAAQAAPSVPSALGAALAGFGSTAAGAATASAAAAGTAAGSIAKGTTHMMLIAKLQSAFVTATAALVTVGGGTVVVLHQTASPQFASAAAPAAVAAATATAPAGQRSITIQAYIDGRSYLRLRGKTAQWAHEEFAAPGRFGGQDRPTVLNGKNWKPDWPDLAPENRNYQGVSSKYEELDPPLPATAVDVTLVPVRVRGKVTVAQQPRAENDYTLTLDYDDGPFGGASNYVVELRWQDPPAAGGAKANTAKMPPPKDLAELYQRLDLVRTGDSVERAKELLGEPAQYSYNQKRLDPANLPETYMMDYPTGIMVLVRAGSVAEFHVYEPGYTYRGKFGIGSTIDEVMDAVGPPTRTEKGKPVGFEDGVLYLDAPGTTANPGARPPKGMSLAYFSSSEKGVRVFFRNGQAAELMVGTSAMLPPGSDADIPDLAAKVAKLKPGASTRDDVVAVMGEPIDYLYGPKKFTKDDLPKAYYMAYPGQVGCFMADGKLVETRLHAPNYAYRGKLRPGDSLKAALDVLGPPAKTLTGKPNAFEPNTLYQNIDGRAGHHYYARPDLGVRLFFEGDRIIEMSLTGRMPDANH